MKILALGGSGGMGRFAVRSIINHKAIKKIYIADLNGSSAKDFASNFDDRVEGLELDITDNIALINNDRYFARRLRAILERNDIKYNDFGGWLLSTSSFCSYVESIINYFIIADNYINLHKQ